jgi:heme/copper-type cytochrome/quinol oxidase subunit 2
LQAVSRAQRLTFLGIAAAIAIVAVVLLLATGGDDDEQEAAATPTPTATATATATAEPDASATATPTETPTPGIPTLTGDGVTKLEFEEGDEIRFRVRADVTDHVHVHGYDLMKDVSPGKPVTFAFPATITGIFEIEFEDAGQQIGQLRVDPD